MLKSVVGGFDAKIWAMPIGATTATLVDVGNLN